MKIIIFMVWLFYFSFMDFKGLNYQIFDGKEGAQSDAPYSVNHGVPELDFAGK